MAEAGYYRFPSIHGEDVVFVSEDDLWHVPADGGVARRLTGGIAAVTHPAISPDGKHVAFSGKLEGPAEVYLMPLSGGEPKRITFTGHGTNVVGWDRQGRILFISSWRQPFPSLTEIYAIPPDGGMPEKLPYGWAKSISLHPGGGIVIGRNAADPAIWKRYRGGTEGEIWIDPEGKGAFRKLLTLAGNVSRPMWIGERIFFLSDHEGVGNLYSCRVSGEDLRRHTHHETFYVRNPSTDGRRIVYHAGGDLYLYDPSANETSRIEIVYPSPRPQRRRRFVRGADYLDDFRLDPSGKSLALIARGRAFTVGIREKAFFQHGLRDGVRYRLPTWLSEGKRLLLVSDECGEETLELHHVDPFLPPRRLDVGDIGSPLVIEAAPRGDLVALGNHRCELFLLDLAQERATRIDRSPHGMIRHFDWSPDGRYLAYSVAVNRRRTAIRIYDTQEECVHPVTEPILSDTCPVFDPEGKYLYFLSYREFDPVQDDVHFDLGFPRGARPYLATLRKETPDPLLPREEEETSRQGKGEPGDGDAPESLGNDREDAAGVHASSSPAVEIDFEGISERIVPLPVPLGRYWALAALPKRLLFLEAPIKGMLGRGERPDQCLEASLTLKIFDLTKQRTQTLITGISAFHLAANRKKLCYRKENRLRVVPAGEPIEKKGSAPGGEEGWIALEQLSVGVEPALEWRQLYREAWRLQRDYFWNEEMSAVDWEAVYERYLPLLDRISTRSECSDLLWEMQGELGTSHAYEFGGDRPPSPRYPIGFLGADFSYDPAHALWRFSRIYRGDPWNERESSPLLRPGVNVAEGDTLLAINGQRLDAGQPPSALLVDTAGKEVLLTVGNARGQEVRHVRVRTLAQETPLFYREWVNRNRSFVHERSGKRVGYIHIPNMGPRGYAEFHRHFLTELDREALIVDLRFNGGGNVSVLLLEKLARKRVGYSQSRWFGVEPYPKEATSGVLVALTNEYAGSDGDIFSHVFKRLQLGPLVGKRTWGGVVGVWPRHRLIDGTITTQPEFSLWFEGVGWGIENHGAEPDIEVEIRPQDFQAGRDPQLERALAEALDLLEKHPPRKPDLEANRPQLPLPKLPKGE